MVVLVKQSLRTFLTLIIALVFISACSSGGREERLELKKFFVTGAYDQAIHYIDNSKFYREKNELLLGLLEKGMILHAKGEWLESNRMLDQARKISADLYTISLSKKTEKALFNDNFDLFYGEVYERSLIHFYLSLNAILNYQKTNQRDDLFKARAEVLAWDSFLSSVKEDRLGKSVYKNDLLLKLYGAKIHEMMGTREDRQIALQLYKDAQDVVFKNYNTYPSFNHNYKLFKQDFEKLASMPLTEIKKKYINESDHQKVLNQYIQQNINRLTKAAAPRKTGEVKAFVTIVFEKGLIAEKVAEKSFYSLDFLAREPLLALFVADVLGLLPAPNTYNPGGAYLGLGVATVALKTIGVGFELPKVLNINIPKIQTLIVKNNEGKEILKKEISLVNPLGDIAEEAIYESSGWVYSRVGIRLASKHAAAIAASFATYKALGGGQRQENFLAKNAAMVQYIGAAKAIEESEKADTRNWSTLPNEIRLVDLDLTPGAYQLEITVGDNEKLFLGEITVNPSETPQLFKVRKI